MAPQQLKAHQAASQHTIHQMGKWLVSTLIWMPLFIPTLALGLKMLPLAPKTSWTSEFYLAISIGFLLVWGTTSWMTGRKGWLILLNLVILVLGLLFGIIVILSGITNGSASPWLSLVILLAMSFSGPVADTLGHDVRGHLLDGVFSAAIFFGWNRWGMHKELPSIMRRQVQAEKPFLIVQASMVTLLLLYAIIIWISFFGGMQF